MNPTIVQWRIQDPNQDTPIVQQFSIGPEFQFAENMVGAVEYVGNRTRNGRRLRNLNEGIIQPAATGVFPYAQYGYGNAYLEQIVTNGRADYNALQMRMQRRMSGGLAYTVAYTWSKARGRLPRSPERRRRRDRQRARIDLRDGEGLRPARVRHPASPGHELHLRAAVRRRAARSIPAASLGAIARGWSVNGILTLSDGRPFTVTTTDQAQTGPGRIARANCVGDAGAERLQPDAGFVDGSGGVRADDGHGPTATAPTTRCADPDRSR